MSARSRTFLVAGAAAACAGLMWLAWAVHQSRAAIASQLAATRDQQAKLELALRAAQNTKVDRSAAPSAAGMPASTPRAAPAAPKTTVRKNAPSVMDMARDNPQLLNDFIASQKADLQQRYGVLFQQQRLTPEQREKFKEIQAAGMARSLDIGAALLEQGLTYDDPAAKKLRDDSERQTDQELAVLLGDAGFQSYQDFNRTLSVRGFVDGFAVQMAETEPLNGVQAEQLAQALIAAGSRGKGGYIDPATLNWVDVDRAAQAFLTPTQFAAWKLGVAHNPAGGSRADQELRKLYNAVVAKNAPPKS